MAPLDAVLREVLDLTAASWTDDFVALYAYGGFVTGEVDDWSDLDVCLVWKRSNEARSAFRNWMTLISDRIGLKVDPNWLSTDCMGEDAPWEFAFILRALRHESRLLLGDDVRSLMAMPSAHKLRLGTCKPGLIWVRLLYCIPKEQPLPQSLPVLDICLDRGFPPGNIAWAIGNTAVHLLRAALLLDADTFIDDRRQMECELRRRGERLLGGRASDALSVRGKLPRFGPIEAVPPCLKRLSRAIPQLTARLLGSMQKCGLEDPSWEPDGQSLYLPDGTLREYQ